MIRTARLDDVSGSQCGGVPGSASAQRVRRRLLIRRRDGLPRRAVWTDGGLSYRALEPCARTPRWRRPRALLADIGWRRKHLHRRVKGRRRKRAHRP